MPPLPEGWITPRWDMAAAPHVVTTTREDGVSEGPYRSLNLGAHVGDDPERVLANRARLLAAIGCARIQWLDQVHGVRVIEATGSDAAEIPEADAAWTRQPGVALAVLTADCLPVVIAPRGGEGVAVAHAGWRGLAGGVLEATVAALPFDQLIGWIGPGIGPAAYEVGEEVADAVTALGASGAAALSARSTPGKYSLDLFELASRLLATAGVESVACERNCTAANPRLYSYRRDGLTGRMATLAWIG